MYWCRKPTSTHSTPARRTHSTVRNTPVLTESEEDEVETRPETKPSPNEGGNLKKKALFAMFGKKAALGKGGKGKGKGRKGKSGGINCIVGEREDEEREREAERPVSPVPPQPVITPKSEPKEVLPPPSNTKLDQDLVLSEEEEEEPPAASVIPPVPVKYRSNGRPSLVFSIPVSRVSRLTGQARAQAHRASKDKKGKDRWITSKGTEDNQKTSENSNSEHAPGVRGRSSSRQRNSHRKATDRTLAAELHNSDAASSDYEKSKKRDREFEMDNIESSPGFGPSNAKRVRDDDEEEEDSFPASSSSAAPPSFLPGADGVGLMPPPRKSAYTLTLH